MVFQELNIWNVSFLYWLSSQNIPFDEYNNFRQFKVSYKDTTTIYLLFTLDFTLVFKDQNNNWGASYLNSE